jgi:hypothetical protein
MPEKESSVIVEKYGDYANVVRRFTLRMMNR